MKRTDLLLILSLMIISSCGNLKHVSYSGMDVIRMHYYRGDVCALINDLYEYPFYREDIEKYLYKKLNYKNEPYRNLKQYVVSSEDDFNAFLFFDSLRVAREKYCIDSLSRLTVQEVGEFYRSNETEHTYLYEELKNAYFTNIDTLDYSSLKLLYQSFRGTNLEKLVQCRYSELRDSLLSIIMTNLNGYFKEETTMLYDIESSVRDYAERYIQNGITEILSSLIEKNDRGFFQKVFKSKEMDSYTFEEYAEQLINEHLNMNSVISVTNDKLNKYIYTCSNFRDNLYKGYFTDTSCRVRLDYETLNVSLNWNKERDGMDEMDNIKATANAITASSIVLAFIPGLNVIAAAADMVDFIYSINQGTREEKAMKNLVSALYIDSVECVGKYLDAIFSNVSQNRSFTEKEIKKAFYENF